MGTSAVPNLAYVIVMDELNRWAPRGANDAITRLIERVVTEMRSQGVILFGAQQQASQVSPKVIENCGIQALGRTGALELGQSLWSFLGSGAKRRVQALGPDEKLVYAKNFRQPMHVRMPYPRWAMRRDEATLGGKRRGFDEREAWER
jgi:DNA helicase HerA-like ATPase